MKTLHMCHSDLCDPDPLCRPHSLRILSTALPLSNDGSSGIHYHNLHHLLRFHQFHALNHS
ncbi:hypothetical protein [uncultured Methanobrevibacter sp.]|uniref:hypothetical protein n=1 Tax=uncultured Methanobrevibacter sp. TaxID=253161 RepID=UPI0025EE1DC4|nr:hypothetical protein [uncultured Methanobrevibacter sp.]